MRKTLFIVITAICILFTPAFILAQPSANDHDNDLIIDSTDVDDDNDGVPDRYEFATEKNEGFTPANDPSADDDLDGIPNYMDADITSCGSLVTGVCISYDIDEDGIPNHFDLDSDNDGIPDVIEAGGHDNNGDGRLDCSITCDTDADGLLAPVDISATKATYSGINISKEAINPNIYVYGGNFYNGILDTDTDKVPDFLDIDSDNDGIYDIIETGGAEADGNGRVDFTGTYAANDTDNDGLINVYDADTNNDGDVNDTGEGISKALIISISDATDGIADNWSDGPTANAFPIDFDSDLLPNYRDLESDSDGLNDMLEAGASAGDNDGIIGGGVYNIFNFNVDGYRSSLTIPLISTNSDTTGDGRPDDDNDQAQSPYINGGGATFFNPDQDGDSRLNFIDLDSDNDGINDIDEHIGVVSINDVDGDGVFDIKAETDFDGIAAVADGADGAYGDAGNVTPVNTDGPDPKLAKADSDNVPDYLDLDSDNDGVYDTEEGGNLSFDADGDAIIDCTGNIYIACDSDMDGILDLVDGAGEVIGDLPGNALPNSDGGAQTLDYRDLDSDNNSIKDIVQKAPPVLTDTDNDGRVDGTDTDDDGIINTILLDSNNIFGGTSGPNNPLPVTLSYFEAKIINKEVVLSWKTFTEINSSYFDVLRSADGIKFETIGTVAARGNSSVVIDYSINDINPAEGINYYRLKIVDTDNHTDYSKIINIKFSEIFSNNIIINPNPVHGDIRINFNGLKIGSYKVVVNNSFGQIQLINTIDITRSNQKIVLQPKNTLAKGIYILTIQNKRGITIFSNKVFVE